MSKRQSSAVIEVSVGFAADGSGSGVAYAAIGSAESNGPLRIPFAVRRAQGPDGREIAYAALRAVAEAVRERVCGGVRFTVADQTLVTDLGERRALPTSLTMPYVALRCSLNRYPSAEVVFDRTPPVCDLSARALAEVSLHVAA